MSSELGKMGIREGGRAALGFAGYPASDCLAMEPPASLHCARDGDTPQSTGRPQQGAAMICATRTPCGKAPLASACLFSSLGLECSSPKKVANKEKKSLRAARLRLGSVAYLPEPAARIADLRSSLVLESPASASAFSSLGLEAGCMARAVDRKKMRGARKTAPSQTVHTAPLNLDVMQEDPEGANSPCTQYAPGAEILAQPLEVLFKSSQRLASESQCAKRGDAVVSSSITVAAAREHVLEEHIREHLRGVEEDKPADTPYTQDKPHEDLRALFEKHGLPGASHSRRGSIGSGISTAAPTREHLPLVKEPSFEHFREVDACSSPSDGAVGTTEDAAFDEVFRNPAIGFRVRL